MDYSTQGGFEPDRTPDSAVCQQCGSLTYSKEWHEAFQVLLCNQCKKNEPLMSKGKAKSVYLLTDKDFKLLGFITKQNPQQKSWSAMKLYLQRQLEAAAWQRWGGEEGLAAERQRRADTAIDLRLKRKREEQEEEEQEATGRKVVDTRLAAELERVRKEHGGPQSIDCAEVEAEEF